MPGVKDDIGEVLLFTVVKLFIVTFTYKIPPSHPCNPVVYMYSLVSINPVIPA